MIKIKEGWHDCKKELPSVGAKNWSKVIYLKVNGVKYKGYYDGFLKKWFAYDHYDMSNECNPTHWRYMTQGNRNMEFAVAISLASIRKNEPNDNK